MTASEFSRSLGRNLKHLRTICGLSAETVAEKIGVGVDTVYKYERGERALTIENKYRFAEALGVNPQSIEDNIMGQLPELRRDLRKTSPEEQQIFRWLASEWDGDVKALIIFCGMLARFPEQERRDIYMSADIVKDRLLASGDLRREDLPAGMDYMEQQLGKLYEK